jgi:LuxR family maltose regulon positive regulatory protein
VEGAALLLHALIGRRGLGQLRADAARAFALHQAGSPYRAVACELEGVALRLLGQADEARARLEEAMALGRALAPAVEAQCAAQLALLALERGAWAEAEVLSDRAKRIVDAELLAERPAMTEVLAVAALVGARRGSMRTAGDDMKRSLGLLTSLERVAPWMAIEARVILARVATALGQVTLARSLLDHAASLLQGVADAGSLPVQLEEARASTSDSPLPLALTVTPLTPAELRVLGFLPTHMSFSEIANELFVSRNTVKTQAIAIYRKLEVSSRTQAVERARSFGLIPS